eukprot:Plantae.Rhodophyta-Hildenbrandia_rubra.ctg23350.p1 GENE.Plantae.Rhodophyta-Hildenbrandia_rubra.ctg23350~~Plantae.Rhodophyta-Hildenbrandia_rubra.ctg23350.p1  ORF type:complete len:601 (-),score=103.04 Plantae.Rhodophyta-Hildenbrandia_rubra.ctg23350:2496-4298(-)
MSFISTAEPSKQDEIPPSPKNNNPANKQLTKREVIISNARQAIASMMSAVDRDKALATEDPTLTFSQNPLRAFSSSEMVTVQKFINLGGLKSLVLAIRKYVKSSDVVERGCRALTSFALFASSAIAEMVKVGVIKAILEAVAKHSEMDNTMAVAAGIKTLRNLTTTAEDRKQIVEEHGIGVIIAAMRKHAENPRIASQCCLVLSNLSFGSTENKEKIGNGGGIAAISEAMKTHRDYQPVQARGSLALRNLCYLSEANQGAAGEGNAIDSLLIAIETYPKDREVVHQSCVAITNLSNLNEKNRSLIVRNRGAEIIVNLMKAFPDSATVNDDCVGVLRNVSVGNERAQIELGKNGGIECIVGAMKRLPTNSKVAEKACASLRYLCFLADNRKRIHECQGMQTIIQAMAKNEDSPTAVENAMLAIGNASFESLENKETAGRCGGIQALVSATERHRQSAVIQEHGCRVLRNLSDGCEMNQRLEAEHGAINTAVFAMMGYLQNASVQEQGCAMLLNIAMCEVNRAKLEEADVEQLVEKALKNHTHHRGVQLQGGLLLDKLHGYEIDTLSSPRNFGGARSQSEAFKEDSEPSRPRRLLSKLIGKK